MTVQRAGLAENVVRPHIQRPARRRCLAAVIVGGIDQRNAVVVRPELEIAHPGQFRAEIRVRSRRRIQYRVRLAFQRLQDITAEQPRHIVGLLVRNDGHIPIRRAQVIISKTVRGHDGLVLRGDTIHQEFQLGSHGTDRIRPDDGNTVIRVDIPLKQKIAASVRFRIQGASHIIHRSRYRWRIIRIHIQIADRQHIDIRAVFERGIELAATESQVADHPVSIHRNGRVFAEIERCLRQRGRVRVSQRHAAGIEIHLAGETAACAGSEIERIRFRTHRNLQLPVTFEPVIERIGIPVRTIDQQGSLRRDIDRSAAGRSRSRQTKRPVADLRTAVIRIVSGQGECTVTGLFHLSRPADDTTVGQIVTPVENDTARIGDIARNASARSAIADRKRSRIDRRRAGISLVGRQCQDAIALFAHASVAADDAAKSDIVAPVENDSTGICNIADNDAVCSAIPDLKRPGIHFRPTRIGVDPGQGQRSVTILHEVPTAIDHTAVSDIVTPVENDRTFIGDVARITACRASIADLQASRRDRRRTGKGICPCQRQGSSFQIDRSRIPCDNTTEVSAV